MILCEWVFDINSAPSIQPDFAAAAAAATAKAIYFSRHFSILR